MSPFAAIVAALITGVTALGALTPMAFFSPGEIFSSVVGERGPKITRGAAYGPNPRQKLDVYEPSAPCASGAVVLFLYGGAWTSGERATYGFVGSALASRGITTVIADYRLYPEVRFPGFVDDAAQAYAWVAKNFGQASPVAPSRARPIFVMGHSAGAHSAALITYDQSYFTRAGTNLPRPAGFIGLAGPYAFDPTTWPSTKDIFATAKSADSARPVSFVRTGAPPALLLHGAADTTVKLFNSRDLATALRQAGTPVEAVEYPGIGHVGLVLTLAGPLRWRAPALEATIAFIARFAGPSASCTLRPQ
jgi:acetyl esterase/lipase